MLDVAVTWLLANPLTSVGALALFAAAVAVVLVPRVHELVGHGHPRC